MIRFCQTSSQFQAALDAAVAGDVIQLDHTKTFLGWFIIRNRGLIPDTNRIIIEGDGDKSLLPQDGYRIFPSFSNLLPKVGQDPTFPSRQNEEPIIFEAGANGYTLRLFQILPNMFGNGRQLIIGNNDSSQTEYSQQPDRITVDRVIIHGDPIVGGKNGFSHHGKNIKLINCHLDYHIGYGQDATCIGGGNGEGPVLIENCYLAGGAYSHITYGFDPPIKTVATVLASPAPTTNSCTLSTIKDLKVGQQAAFLYTDPVSLKLRRKHPHILTINTTTNAVTYDDMGVVPDVPGDFRWGIQLKGLTIRRCHMTKHLEWKDPILGTPIPDAGTATPIGTGGIASGDWYWTFQAVLVGSGYQNSSYYSAVSVEKKLTLATTSNVTFNWPAIPNANTYRIYRYQKDVAGNFINMRYFETGNLTFTDIGGAGTTTGAFRSKKGDKWVIKNILEFKGGVDILIEDCVLEYHWTGADVGHSVWMKNNNQDGSHEFSEVKNVTMRRCVMRHVGAGISMSGSRSGSNSIADLPGRMTNILVENCLLHDSTIYWTEGSSIFSTNMIGGMVDAKLDHCTFLHTVSGAVALGTQVPDPGELVRPVWTNSIFINNDYGFKGQDGPSSPYTAIGKTGMDSNSLNTETFNKNVLAGANASQYNFPGMTNYFPDMTTFANQFKNYDNAINGDYRLKRISEGDSIDSLYINAGTDGKDIGCDINLLMNSIAGVIEGVPSGTSPDVPPPPPPPPVSSNIITKQISFNSPVATGQQTIDLGFQPKVLLFYTSLNPDDGVVSSYNFGLGCACADGTQWSGSTNLTGGVTTPLVTDRQKIGGSEVIGILNSSNGYILRGQVTAFNLTGFTMNWMSVSATSYVINCLAIGGDGVVNAKAFTQLVPTVVGDQDINVGFDADSVLFYMPVNVNSPLPYTGSKHTSMCLGVCDNSLVQVYIINRLNSGVDPNKGYRTLVSNKAFGVMFDNSTALEASVSAFITNGFRLNYSTVAGEANVIFGLALKGPKVKAQLFTEPVANGDVDYTTGFKPEAVILAGNINPTGSGKTAHARFSIGAAGNPIASQSTIVLGHRDAVSVSIAESCLDRTTIYRGRQEGGTELSKASLKAYKTNGYTLTWSGTPSGNEVLSIAIGQSSAPLVPINLATVMDYDVDFTTQLNTGILLAVVMDYGMDVNSVLVSHANVHKSIVQFFDLRVNLDVKREMDSGTVNVLSTDVGGTQVNFKKAFKDVDSITLTVSGTTPVTAIYDFADIPNPIGFKILAFTSAGARVNATVSWKARGIV